VFAKVKPENGSNHQCRATKHGHPDEIFNS
jgi:hypothetical protein